MIKSGAPDDRPVEPSLRRLAPEDISPLPHALYNIMPNEAISPPVSATKQVAMTHDKTLIQSVSRALDILEILAGQSGVLRLQDITARSGLNRSTCHHLLNTLVHRGYVNRHDDSRTYQLSGRLLELVHSNNRGSFDLVSESLPELRRLSHEINETVLLAIFSGSNLTIITRQEPDNGRRMEPGEIGAAAHATAVGKAMLAWLPEPQIARVVADQGLTPFTRKTIDSLATLVENLRQIRRHGFALEDEEFMPGQSGIACAIRGESGEVLGAVGCIMPTVSASNTRLQQLQRMLTESAALLSRRSATR
ncbi:IclR family transcriptional regulator [Erwinia endophytica]|uniref:IclR family transcriptional regulator n=1 Tax=Erwinia endophytica TaxID=1563158 RepID=UPI001265F6AD|nr:IclR family transcriptional regulator [Erwinia endophytica]KAB8309443.1 IclR family transcriptional regulator [Erwinia endophytica]